MQSFAAFWDCAPQGAYGKKKRCMKTREEVLARLSAAKTELQEQFKVRALALFGSYARNQQTEQSDVDVLVEVDPSIGLEFVNLAEELEKRLRERVDLVSTRAVKPNRWQVIKPDLIYV